MSGAGFDQALAELLRRAARNDPGVLATAQHLANAHADRHEGWVFLSRLQRAAGDHLGGASSIARAFALQPDDAQLALECCVAQFQHGDAGAAARTLDVAIDATPDHVELLFHRGYLFELAGADLSAEHAYRRALAIDASHAASLANLGVLLRRMGRLPEARQILESALQRNPSVLLAKALVESSDAAEQLPAALHYAEAAAMAEPTSASGWLVAATAARKLRDPVRAEGHLRRAEGLVAANDAATCRALESERAALAIDVGDYTGSRRAFGSLLRQSPDDLAVRWQAAMAMPQPPMSAAEAMEARSRFDTDLAEIGAIIDRASPAMLRDVYAAACSFVPFALAYLPGEPTDSMCTFGRLVQRIVAAQSPQLAAPVPWKALQHGGRIRVGFVSMHLRLHTVTRYFRHWLDGVDRRRFDVSLWHLGSMQDDVTAALAASADRLIAHGGNPSRIAESIREARIDVLVFLDIGMDARIGMVAALRSAPVQCVAYGHPLTTGLPTIDVYFSGVGLEREDAASRYTERLVCLPGLGARPLQPEAPNLSFAAPRRDGRKQILCTQMPFKLQPAFDDLAADLLAATDAELFVFAGQGMADVLQQRVLQRLANRLRAGGVDPRRHLRLLPNCGYADYLGVVANADLVIDTPGFTGGATSLDAFHVGTPVATIDGVALRGRQTAAMARIIEVDDLVADDAAGCVRRAAELLANPCRLSDLRSRTAAAAPLLFNDDRSVVAFNDVLQQLAEEARDR